ncbi:N-acetyltransferase [Corynebacterium callunae]|uniref:N-acetyltransferase n=1 Tax=Corynebacterium callunae TaxID=1721 RepID=UPI0039825031
MRFFQLADQVAGQDPDDLVRSFVFMSNMAAQETAGNRDVSISLERIQRDLVGSPEMSAQLHIATFDPPDAEWIEPAGFLKINLPLIDDTASASLDIVLDAGLQPLPGERLSTEAITLIDALLQRGESTAANAPWQRSIFHTAHMHPAGGLDDCDYCAVLIARGYQLAHEEIQQTLPVQPQPWTLRDQQLRTVVGSDFPAELIPGIIELENIAARDTPHGRLSVAPEPWSVERLAQQAQRIAEFGTKLFTVLSLDELGVSGMSSISMAPGTNPDVAEQGLTIVHPRARGRGLSRHLKGACMELLSLHHPAVKRVATSNAVDNQEMLAINRALGAQEISRTTLWEKRENLV